MPIVRSKKVNMLWANVNTDNISQLMMDIVNFSFIDFKLDRQTYEESDKISSKYCEDQYSHINIRWEEFYYSLIN